MIDSLDMDPFEVQFSFQSDDGELIAVAVDRLRARLKTHPRPVVRLLLSQKDADTIQTNQGVEQHRLERIREEDLDRYPLLFLNFEDGTQILADGNHSYLAAYHRFKRKWLPAVFLKPPYWRPFTLRAEPALGNEEMRQFLKTVHSGIR